MGSGNIGIGSQSGQNLTTGSNNIDIGNAGLAGDPGFIRIGTSGTQTNAFMGGIFGVSVPNGLGVVVDGTGRLGTVPSSERFKAATKPTDKVSEAVLALKPVTFHYKRLLDPKSVPQFGLVAEDVAKVNPDLVARDERGEIYTVRYDAVNAMLLNEFLKEHKKVEERQPIIADLKATVARQEKRFTEQQTQIEALASGLQKVSAQFEVNKPAPQVAVNR